MQSNAVLSMVEMTSEPFAYVTRICKFPDIGATIGAAFEVLETAFAQAKTQPAGPPMARYSGVSEGSVTIDLGFPVREGVQTSLRAAGLKIGATAGGKAMHAVHVGPYEKVKLTYDAILDAIGASGRAPAEEMWERYLSPPDAPAEAQRTEVFWPVKPALASYE